MRLLFKKTKQKELIKKFKEENNLTWKAFSNYLKIKTGKLNAYYEEDSLIPEEIYYRIDSENKFSRFILKKLPENWGKIKGGFNSPGKTKKIKFPKDSKDFAEFYGIMLGDGNSNRTKSYKVGTYMIRIVGDTNKDRDYLISYVKPIIERLFSIKVREGKFKSNAMFLESKGFKPGNKIKNELDIPLWIKNNSDFLRVCLRGLYDTDGCIYKLTNQNSYQISFSNTNPKLLNDVRQALLSLGIFPSKITKGKEIVITKKTELGKFLKLIGFHNLKHLNKIKMLRIAP
jgi:hypothetical protein